MATSRRAALFARLALAAASTVAALCVGEVAVRAAHLGVLRYPRHRDLEAQDKRAAIDAYATNPHGEFELDLRVASIRARARSAGIAGVEQASGRTPYGVWFTYNDDGCRDRARTPRTPGVMRIVVLGDSFTEGQGVPEERTFARRIETMLRASGVRVEVFNCGRRGRDFPELLTAFRRLQVYEPDVVLYAMVLNDAAQSPALRARQQYLNDWIVDRGRQSDVEAPMPITWAGSQLVGLVRERIAGARISRETTRWYRDMYGAPNADGWSETQSMLAVMDATMRLRGGRLLVAVLPLLVGLRGAYPFGDVVAEILRACAARGLTCHDVAPAFRGLDPATQWVHPVDMHPNGDAHARIARDLLPWVRAAIAR